MHEGISSLPRGDNPNKRCSFNIDLNIKWEVFSEFAESIFPVQLIFLNSLFPVSIRMPPVC